MIFGLCFLIEGHRYMSLILMLLVYLLIKLPLTWLLQREGSSWAQPHEKQVGGNLTVD